MAFDSEALARYGEEVKTVVQSDSLDRTVLTYTVEDFDAGKVTIDNRDYQLISVDHAGFVMMGQAGHPQLPALCDSLMIPDTAQMNVEVTKSEFIEISGVDLAPWKGPILRSVDPETVDFVFGEAYGKNEWFPGKLTSLRDPYILHDVRGVVVEVFPFQYNPVQRTLRVYHRIEVEVAKTGESGVNTIDRATFGYKPDTAFEALYMNQFANYSLQLRPGSGTRVDPPSENGDMLVICYGSFMANMQPLVDWKNLNGINTTMVDIATVGNTATAIKNYITSLYYSSNLAYVLLVGDHTQVTSSSYSYGVSDPDFSTITADTYPDLFVGRFSAENTSHVDTQVQRTIEYEQMDHSVSQGGWHAAGTGIGSSEGAGYGHYGEADWQHEDLIRGELLAYGFTTVDQIYDPGATAGQVSAALNQGRRCVNYTGHGWTQGWGTTYFSNTHVNALTNVGMLPFVCSVACNGGDFDYGTCFGEAWLRATHGGEPTGAIAAYCSSIGQYWAEPMYGQGNHGTSGKYGAAERFWMEMNNTICGSWYGGSCCMMDLCGSTGVDMFMTWTCFGDPSLKITGGSSQGPTPDVKVNGQDGPLTVTPTENVTITLSLDPGSMTGDPADFWVFITKASAGTWWYIYPTTWQKSSTPIRAAAAPIQEVINAVLYNGTMPVGTYTISFAVDDQDNNYEGDYIDTAEVTSQ